MIYQTMLRDKEC